MFLLPDFTAVFWCRIWKAKLVADLIGGQFVSILYMAMRLIPMSGRSTLTINGIALCTHILLNWYYSQHIHGCRDLHVDYAWTVVLWRLIDIWHLMRCFPFASLFFVFGMACGIVSVIFIDLMVIMD